MTGCPRLLDGIAFVPVRDGYVVEGFARREVFTGRVPVLLFGPLLPLLDGTRRTDEIAGLLGAPHDLVRDVVALLARRGLLQPPAGTSDSPWSVFLGRTLPAGRAEAVRRRLREATVAVVGDAGIAGPIAELLRQSDVGEVRRACDPGAGQDLVVEVGPAGAHSGGPWLPVRTGPGRVVVGPVLGMPGSGCPHCLEPGAAGRPEAGEPGCLGAGEELPAGSARPGDPMASVAGGVAAGAVLRLLGGFGTSGVWRAVREIALPELLPHARSLPVTPCTVCGGGAVEAPPWSGDRLTEPASMPAKRYLTEPRRRLRQAGVATRAVARMLRYAVGPSAPSAGGPGTRRAYLVEPDGSAAYLDLDANELVRLRSGTAVDEDSWTVCLTADLTAMTTAFGAAARRLLWQDSGLAVAQLHACARQGGWQAGDVRDPFDAVGVLELDPGREVVTATLSLSPGAARRLREPRPVRQTYSFAPEPVDPETAELLAATGTLVLSARGPLETYLRDRDLTPGGLLLYLGTDGEPAALQRAAAQARAAQLAAARSGLASGLFARLPPALLSAEPGEQILYGCAFGYPAAAADSRITGSQVVW